MTKDRIEELRAAQNEETSTLLGNKKDEGHLKIEIGSNRTTYNVSKPPPAVSKSHAKKETKELDDIYEKVKRIRELIERVQDDTIALRKIQDALLRVAVTTGSDDGHTKLDESLQNIRETSKKCRSALTELERGQKGGGGGGVVQRVLASQVPMLHKQYLDAMREYQDALATHKEKAEQLIKKQLNIANQSLTNEQLEELFDKQDTSVFVGNYIQETMETRQNLQDIRDRHKDLLKLEAAIVELHDMFGDMADLVDNQGAVIDRVESYVGKGAELVEGGRGELHKAKENRTKARKKKILLIVCLVSVVAILLLVAGVEMYLGANT